MEIKHVYLYCGILVWVAPLALVTTGFCGAMFLSIYAGQVRCMVGTCFEHVTKQTTHIMAGGYFNFDTSM